MCEISKEIIEKKFEKKKQFFYCKCKFTKKAKTIRGLLFDFETSQ